MRCQRCHSLTVWCARPLCYKANEVCRENWLTLCVALYQDQPLQAFGKPLRLPRIQEEARTTHAPWGSEDGSRPLTDYGEEAWRWVQMDKGGVWRVSLEHRWGRWSSLPGKIDLVCLQTRDIKDLIIDPHGRLGWKWATVTLTQLSCRNVWQIDDWAFLILSYGLSLTVSTPKCNAHPPLTPESGAFPLFPWSCQSCPSNGSSCCIGFVNFRSWWVGAQTTYWPPWLHFASSLGSSELCCSCCPSNPCWSGPLDDEYLCFSRSWLSGLRNAWEDVCSWACSASFRICSRRNWLAFRCSSRRLLISSSCCSCGKISLVAYITASVANPIVWNADAVSTTFRLLRVWYIVEACNWSIVLRAQFLHVYYSRGTAYSPNPLLQLVHSAKRGVKALSTHGKALRREHVPLFGVSSILRIIISNYQIIQSTELEETRIVSIYSLQRITWLQSRSAVTSN